MVEVPLSSTIPNADKTPEKSGGFEQHANLFRSLFSKTLVSS